MDISELHLSQQEELINDQFIKIKKRIILENSSSLTLILGKLCFLMNFGLVLVVLLYHHGDYASSTSELLSRYSNTSSLYKNVFIIVWVFKGLIILVLIFKYSSAKWRVTQLYDSLFSYFSILKEVDYSVSLLLLLVQWRQNLPSLLVSCFLQVYDAVYNCNYHNRKIISYMTSSALYLVFKLIVISYHLFAIASVCQNDKVLFQISTMISCLLLFGWYLKYGKYLYHHKTMENMTRAYICLYIALLYIVFQNLVYKKDPVFRKKIAEIVLLLVIPYFSIYIGDRKDKESLIFQTEIENIKYYELELLSKLEISDKRKGEVILQGIIKDHRLKCLNINCNLRLKQFYDIEAKKKCQTSDAKFFKEEIIKQCIICLYQGSLDSSEQSRKKDIMLDYLQFLYNNNVNVFVMNRLIDNLKAFPLDILDKIKVCRYQIFLEQFIKGVSANLYKGKLHFQCVIYYEGIIDEIRAKIDLFVRENIRFYGLLQANEIQTQEIMDIIIKTDELDSKLQQEWKLVGNSFADNNQYLFLYFSYLLFIKNNKLRQQNISKVMNNKDKSKKKAPMDQLFKKNLQKGIQPEQIYNAESFSFTCALRQQNLVILNVSKRFQAFTEYSEKEIIQSNFNILIPEFIKEKHSQIMSEWLTQGSLMSQQTYVHQVTELITKGKKLLSIIKYYKPLYTTENGLEFICLIHVLRQEVPLKQMEESMPVKQFLFLHLNQNMMMRSSATVMQLKNESNIFIKEQSHEMYEQNHLISQVKMVTRLILLLVFVATLTSTFIVRKDSGQMSEYADQFVNFMTLFRFPLAFNINYMKRVSEIGNATNLDKRILLFKQNFINTSQNTKTLKTLFDKDLNKPKIYRSNLKYPQYQNESYDQIDVFHKIVSSVVSLGVPADRHSKQYINLTRFLIPSYVQLCNNTKFELHYGFQNIIKHEKERQIFIIVLLSVVFVILLVFSWFRLMKFVDFLNKVMVLLVEIPKIYSEGSQSYFMKLQQYFLHHFQADRIIKTSKKSVQKRGTLENTLTSQQANLNKKSKNIIQNRDIRKQKCLLSFGIFSNLLVVSIMLYVYLNAISLISELDQFEKDGFQYQKFYPIPILVATGVIQKYLNYLHPNELVFQPKTYVEYLQNLRQLGNLHYILLNLESTKESYLIKRYNYFFGNICKHNPILLASLGVSIQTCQTIADGTLKTGLSSFFRYYYKVGVEYIVDNKEMIPEQVDQYTLSGTIANNYLNDEIQEWNSNMKTKIQDISQELKNSSLIIMAFSLVFHIVLNEIILKRRLNKHHHHLKILFQRLIPDFMLTNQKIFRQSLVQEGLISSK